MKAVVVTIGSELLTPGRRDSNAVWLIARLADHGVPTVRRVVVGDDVAGIAAAVRAAWADADAVLLTGGLGPTEDDRTREALASALDRPLIGDEAMRDHIEAMFRARGRVPGPRQARQAERPAGTSWIENALGSAPGILFEAADRLLAALPGVPAEMKAMFEAAIAPRLAARGGSAMARTTLKIAGRPESYVDDLLRDLYAWPGTVTTILASAGSVELVIVAGGESGVAARDRVEELASAMAARLGADLFGRDDDTLASIAGGLLAARRATVATAESCTGGLLGAALTDVPGSSAWYRGGLVCYADDLKTTLAGVDAALILAHGAVSEPVAAALAAGARAACGADFGLGVTGIAGPTGGTPSKPVGTVHIALSDRDGGKAVKIDWPGDRSLIRRRAVNVALDLLRRRLLDR